MSKTPTPASAEENDQTFFKTLDIYAASSEGIARWLKFNIERDMPCGVFGRAGIGKTQLVTQVAKELGMDLVIFYLHHMEREDLGGFPFPDPTDPHSVIMRLKRQIPKKKSEKNGTILFLDEFNRGERPVVNAAFTMMEHPRIIGDFQLPDDVRIVLSGNPSDAQYAVNEIEKEPAVRRRVCWAGMTVNHTAWIKHAVSRGYHSSVVNYIRRHKPHLYDIEAHNAGKVSANPASWEKVSKALLDAEKACGGDLAKMELELRITLSGLIGMRLTQDFMSEVFADDPTAVVEPEEILTSAFTKDEDVYQRVQRLVDNKRTGRTGKIGDLCTALALTIATQQPAPAKIAGPIARFAALLPSEVQQKFMSELLKMLQEQDPEHKYQPLLQNALKNEPEYVAVVRGITKRGATMSEKIST